MSFLPYLGLLAGILTSGAAVPQVLLTYRTKKAEDLSLWQLLLLTLGLILWLIYGLAIDNFPLILANTFSLFCYALLIAMKLRYAKKPAEPSPG